MSRRYGGSVIVAPLICAAVALVALVGVAAPAQAGQRAKTSATTPHYYLSLGDSYSIGYQPGLPRGGGSPGYTAYVAGKERLTLENFGCGGATTASNTGTDGCFDPAATHAVSHPRSTQAAAALAFIGAPANRGRVGLVTISIGGNDVTACAAGRRPVTAILACVQTADAAIATHVTALVASLHVALSSAGDTSARVIGVTYPDVILGDWVHPVGATDRSLASISVLAFDDLINPVLSAAYGPANFVNVTRAPYKEATKGADTPLTTTVTVKPYGVIPAAVAEICQLTHYCSLGNIHADNSGYTFIGQLIVAHLHR